MTYHALFDFETTLAKYTGAPYAIATDCCTHALELCFRFNKVRSTKFSAYTYLSVPMLMHRLDVDYTLLDEQWEGEYQFHGTNIWDSARRLERNMYKPGMLQCLSFGVSKPLHIGRLGAILTDNVDIYNTASKWRSDGRELYISPWQDQVTFEVGYHYCPTLESCDKAFEKLQTFTGGITTHKYPDLRTINVKN